MLELLDYLMNIEQVDTPPLEAVLAQTEIIGEPALPSSLNVAILHWVGAASDRFEEQYALEEPLATSLRQLRPMVATIAISDPNFLTPGAHPMHQILDTLQECAIGWQASLGRAGQATEQLVAKTIADTLSVFRGNQSTLAEVASSVRSAAERNQARSQRMVKRLVEIEKGQHKSAHAKIVAAQMINAVLEQYALPSRIGQFLKGPWYESAQLVLLKFGEESSQWHEMSETTLVLSQSLQNPTQEGDEHRQRLFERVTEIPGNIRHYLLSRQHDGDFIEQVVGEIEYAQLRLMRHQSIEADKIKPIDTGTGMAKTKDAGGDSLPETVQTKQWFSLSEQKGKGQRLQIALMLEEEQQLIFCNNAGLKVLMMDYRDFAQMLESGKALPLVSGSAYSRSLAEVAGIETVESLRQLTGPSAPVPTEIAAAEPVAEVEETPPSPALEEEETAPELPTAIANIPELPMGTWLGFHDVDPPLLARLAMHDSVRHLYIFVNRKGIELRRLEAEEYGTLFEQGMIDILETRSTFKDKVEQARKNLKHQ